MILHWRVSPSVTPEPWTLPPTPHSLVSVSSGLLLSAQVWLLPAGHRAALLVDQRTLPGPRCSGHEGHTAGLPRSDLLSSQQLTERQRKPEGLRVWLIAQKQCILTYRWICPWFKGTVHIFNVRLFSFFLFFFLLICAISFMQPLKSVKVLFFTSVYHFEFGFRPETLATDFRCNSNSCFDIDSLLQM